MSMTAQTQSVSFGDLVAAIFDQTDELKPTMAGQVATRVVAAVLVRTGNTRVVKALLARRQRQGWRPRRRAVA